MLKQKANERKEITYTLKNGLSKLVSPKDLEYLHNRQNCPEISSFNLKDTWRNKQRNWGHPLHSMASRSGSFPPSLADYFIQHFSNVGDLVLDPYSGKGTTPLQACLLDRTGFGIDVTPEAYILTSAKVSGIKHDEAVQYLKSIEYGISNTNIKDVPSDVKVFFSTKTLAQILVIRERLLEDLELNSNSINYTTGKLNHTIISKKEKLAAYWLGILIGIIHGSSIYSLSLPCSHSFSMAPNYTKNYAKKHGLKKPNRNVLECMIQRSKLLQSEPSPRVYGKAYIGKAESIPDSWENKFHLILTSPPYFTAQSYPWDNWLREWLLGFDFKEVRKQTTHTANEEKYSQAMFSFLQGAHKVLKSGKRAFVVVGDVSKKTSQGKIIIKTSDIISREAKKIGFEVDLVINDDIPPTRRYNSSYLNSNQGLQIDRIVCLRKM